MAFRNQATAEKSKDYILKNLNKELDVLVETSTLTISKAINAILINVIVLLIIILIISLILLTYFGIISYQSAVGVFLIWSISLFILTIMVSLYLQSYIKKKLQGSAKIFYNYVSSEEALDLLNKTASVYLGAL